MRWLVCDLVHHRAGHGPWPNRHLLRTWFAAQGWELFVQDPEKRKTAAAETEAGSKARRGSPIAGCRTTEVLHHLYVFTADGNHARVKAHMYRGSWPLCSPRPVALRVSTGWHRSWPAAPVGWRDRAFRITPASAGAMPAAGLYPGLRAGGLPRTDDSSTLPGFPAGQPSGPQAQSGT